MSILDMATQLLSKQLGGNISADSAKSALQGLIGGSGNDLDISGLVSKLSGGNLAGIVGSWLGDGANQGIDVSQLTDIFGTDKLGTFAQKLGVDEASAANGLSNILPELIDKSSSGGELLSSVGGLGGALNLAKKLF